MLRGQSAQRHGFRAQPQAALLPPQLLQALLHPKAQPPQAASANLHLHLYMHLPLQVASYHHNRPFFFEWAVCPFWVDKGACFGVE